MSLFGGLKNEDFPCFLEAGKEHKNVTTDKINGIMPVTMHIISILVEICVHIASETIGNTTM